MTSGGLVKEMSYKLEFLQHSLAEVVPVAAQKSLLKPQLQRSLYRWKEQVCHHKVAQTWLNRSTTNQHSSAQSSPRELGKSNSLPRSFYERKFGLRVEFLPQVITLHLHRGFSTPWVNDECSCGEKRANVSLSLWPIKRILQQVVVIIWAASGTFKRFLSSVNCHK